MHWNAKKLPKIIFILILIPTHQNEKVHFNLISFQFNSLCLKIISIQILNTQYDFDSILIQCIEVQKWAYYNKDSVFKPLLTLKAHFCSPLTKPTLAINFPYQWLITKKSIIIQNCIEHK